MKKMRVYMETGPPSITGFREHWEAWDSSVLFMEILQFL